MFTTKSNFQRRFVLLSYVFLLNSIIFINPASAEPEGYYENYIAPGHHEFHQWYQEIQKQLNITGCCDAKSRDCGPVSKYQITQSGMIRVLMEDGNWYFTGTAKVYFVSTPDGRAHACRQPEYDLSLIHI